MRKEILFNLRDELKACVEKAHEKAKGMVVDNMYSNLVFVRVKGQQFINPSIMPFSMHFEIVELTKFIRNHKELTDKDVVVVLKSSDEFKDLRDVAKRIPDLVEYVGRIDPTDDRQIPYFYANQLYFDRKKKKIKKQKEKEVEEEQAEEHTI
jgi:hypothetical protein